MTQVRLRSRPVTVSNAEPVAIISRRHQVTYPSPDALTASEIKLRKASKRFLGHPPATAAEAPQARSLREIHSA